MPRSRRKLARREKRGVTCPEEQAEEEKEEEAARGSRQLASTLPPGSKYISTAGFTGPRSTYDIGIIVAVIVGFSIITAHLG